MLIAIVEFKVAPNDRARALAVLEAEVPQVQALPGNLGFRPLAGEGGALVLLHEWADQAAFDAYLAGPVFAASGAAVRPLMSAPPRRRVYAAETVAVA